jgi:hypothetical protein
MYRLLDAAGEVNERQDSVRRPLMPAESIVVPNAVYSCRRSLALRARPRSRPPRRRSRGGRAPHLAWHNASDVKLRNAHLAVIDRSKVLDYLLNETHPDNGGKARFFAMLGFPREDPERLIEALRAVAEHGEVVSSAESVHGEKHVVDGWLSGHTQESRQWSIRTVWIIDCGEDAPRLVTAYPGKE